MVRKFKLATVLVGVLISSAALTAAAQGVLKVRPTGDLKTLDPHITSDSNVRNYGYMVYDTLFAMDDKLQVKPQMVEKWEKSSDGKIYTFTLRSGLKFHDGSAVTAADAVASIKRWGQKDSIGQQLMSRTQSLEAVDARTMKLTLTKPWGLVLDALAKPGAPVPFIMPAKVAAATTDKPIDSIIGSGPFMFKRDEWSPGAKLVFVKNPNYVPRAEPAAGFAGGKKVNFDRVEWHIINDHQVALDALKAGELDIHEEIAADLVAEARKANGIKVVNQDNIGIAQQIRMNWSQPPLNNVKIRQAILRAVSGSDFMQAVTDDKTQYKVCESFYICSSPYFSTAGFPKANLEAAKKLVKESNYDGTPVVLLDPAENFNLHAFVTYADQVLRSIGLKTQVQAMDWATVSTRRASKEPMNKGGWSIFISGPGGLDYMEPSSHLGLRSNCDKAWFGWPCDEQIEKLRADFSEADTDAKRKQIASAIQARAVEVVPYVPIAVQFQVRAYRANLSGQVNPPAPVYWAIERR